MTSKFTEAEILVTDNARLFHLISGHGNCNKRQILFYTHHARETKIDPDHTPSGGDGGSSDMAEGSLN